ncbi:MAG: hypothetical protein K2X35_22550 [Bryobacteraceae bacterium]|nr:hypothetical protein [Bryobacteraceae bacterium]
MKTNAVRALDRLGVAYELRAYEVDPDHLAAGTVARKVGLPPEQVFKTLAVRGDRSGEFLAVIPAGTELNFKRLARLSGDRKVEMVPLKPSGASYRLYPRRCNRICRPPGLPCLRRRDH